MDRGAWRATVYELAKSWTRLSAALLLFISDFGMWCVFPSFLCIYMYSFYFFFFLPSLSLSSYISPKTASTLVSSNFLMYAKASYQFIHHIALEWSLERKTKQRNPKTKKQLDHVLPRHPAHQTTCFSLFCTRALQVPSMVPRQHLSLLSAGQTPAHSSRLDSKITSPVQHSLTRPHLSIPASWFTWVSLVRKRNEANFRFTCTYALKSSII